jgi:lysine-ketoglutarate reductase/saccharopine dehydrogenase-like protein (TIGR00300 family)
MSPVYEDVKLEGHIIDSLILPQVLDDVLSLGGDYEILEIDVGHHKDDLSSASLRVSAKDDEHLDLLLGRIQRHGAQSLTAVDAGVEAAPADGVFPPDFYSSTNLVTYVRWQGRWLAVDRPEMDCGVVIDPAGPRARMVPVIDVRKGELVVVGREGLRVIPLTRPRRGRSFEFMSSEVSSEKPKGLIIAEVARLMTGVHERGEKIVAVVGPAVVHTGAAPALARLVSDGWIDVVFGGNAIAAHDLEASMYGTSLGVSLSEGMPVHGGHEHHLRAINRVRAAGSIKAAVDQGALTSGLFFEITRAGVPFVLAGSIRDDGPLPEVITDVMQAQREMRSHLQGAGLCLMLSTMLHSIATGNLLPATVHTVCVDINPAVVTKLADRGSFQAMGIVTDVALFLGELAGELARAGRS